MSFFGNVLKGINELGGGIFDKHGKIDIHLNQDACFFLHDLDNFNGLLTTKNNFTRIYDYSIHVQFAYTATIGLSLVKNNYNSVGNRVNPDFINTLKKSAMAYMNILTTADWTESTAKKRRWILRSLKKPNDPDVKCVEKVFKEMGDVYRILTQIKKVREDIDIGVQGTTSDDVFLVGTEKNIADFRIVLNEELALIKKNLEETENPQT